MSLPVHPTELLAADIARSALNIGVERVSRFPTGAQHFVYDVLLQDGRAVVLRIAAREYRNALAGALHWSQILRPLGVPLPAIIHTDLSMRSVPFPYLVLERLPGTDLGHVYALLSAGEKRVLAERLSAIQDRVGALPEGQGFGYVLDGAGPFPHATWPAAVEAMLKRSEDRIAGNGIVDPALVVRVRAAAEPFAPYLAAIQPRTFLHDATTKNVIVDQGRLSGIVDVDDLCYGDPLLTVALTNMSLLARGYDTDYIDDWLDAMRAGKAQRDVLTFYTALFCVDFLSELGLHFVNRARAEPVDPDQLARLLQILDGLLVEIEWRR